jgi:hypothetical protein
MKSAAILLLVPFLLAGCRERRDESETSSSDQIIQELVRGGSHLPFDARFAITSYMDTERIRIELTRAQYAGKIASLEDKLDAAAAKQASDAEKYRNSLNGLWDAIRDAEDPNLSEEARQALSQYVPEAKFTAEKVTSTYEAARKAADLYLNALKDLQFDRAQEYHSRYLNKLKEIAAISRMAVR